MRFGVEGKGGHLGILELCFDSVNGGGEEGEQFK